MTLTPTTFLRSEGVCCTVGRVIDSAQNRPITAMFLFAITGYSVWMAYALHFYVTQFPPVRLKGYSGPLTLMSLDTWAALFLITGVATVVRLWLLLPLRLFRWELLIHAVSTFPVLLWCATLILGGPSTSQPTSAFIGFTVLLIPLITPVHEITKQKTFEVVFRQLDQKIQSDANSS